MGSMMTTIKGLFKNKIFVISLVVIAILVITSVTYFVTRPSKKETVVNNNQSSIDIKTEDLTIKEWGIKMPVNGNLLGKVTYTISDDQNTVTFLSSKLDEVDLSTSECSGIKKDSWGVSRSKENPSTETAIVYSKMGEYYIKPIYPEKKCESTKKIRSAFSYMINYMEKIK